MDFEHLIRPLESASGPSGEDLVFSADFDEIQQARRFDDPSLAQGEWVTEVKEADWEQVVRVWETVLAKRAKDLRVAAWLTEAKGKLGGLASLAEELARSAALALDTFEAALKDTPARDERFPGHAART